MDMFNMVTELLLIAADLERLEHLHEAKRIKAIGMALSYRRSYETGRRRAAAELPLRRVKE